MSKFPPPSDPHPGLEKVSHGSALHTLHIYTSSVRQQASLSGTLGQHTHRFPGLLLLDSGPVQGTIYGYMNRSYHKRALWYHQ